MPWTEVLLVPDRMGGSDLRFAVLGPVEVADGDVPVAVGSPQQRVVLGLLALQVGSVVSVDALVDALWPHRVPPSAGNVIQRYVSRLRAVLDPGHGQVIKTRRPGYLLDVDPDQVDARRFEALVRAARAHWPVRPEQVAATLREALELWRGELLADLTRYDLVPAERTRLDRVRRAALDERIDADLALGRHAEVIGELEQLLTTDPLRERNWSQLMLALYRDGRQADALAAFRTVRRTLADELGLQPGPELVELERAILQHDLGRTPGAPSTRSTALPRPRTSFVGRTAELAELDRLATQTRLCTVTGPGGSGKTRIALAHAASVTPAFPDGLWFVELGAATDPVHAVAAALGVADASERSLADGVADRLADAHALVVLDNCEHLTDQCASLAAALLAACPRLHLLATSREPLFVDGELIWSLPPLTEADAVALFAARASGADGPVVGQLCQRLDGLPLAIELAAARAATMSVADIVERLDVRLLSGGAREAPARQRTLRATAEWSYDLLSEPERELFARLSAFAGEFGLDAVAAVGAPLADPVELCGRLVSRSLVVRVGDLTGRTRYRMLQTLRAFAAERLASSDTRQVQRQHAEYYADWAAREAPAMIGPDTGEITPARLDLMEAERADLRQAIEWSLDGGDPPLGRRLLAAVGSLWLARGPSGEARSLIDRALLGSDHPGDPVTEASLLFLSSAFAMQQGDLDRTDTDGARCVALARLRGYEAHVAGGLGNLGVAAWARGDYARAMLLAEESLAGARAVGDRWHTAMNLGNIGRLLTDQGDLDRAATVLDEAVTLAELMADPVPRSFALDRRAALARLRGDLATAAELAGRSLVAARGSGYQDSIAARLRLVGLAAEDRGDRVEARVAYRERLSICRQIGSRGGVATCLEDIAGIAAHPLVAARLLGAADALRTAIGAPVAASDRAEHGRRLAERRVALGESAFADAFATGRQLSLDAAITEANAVHVAVTCSGHPAGGSLPGGAEESR